MRKWALLGNTRQTGSGFEKSPRKLVRRRIHSQARLAFVENRLGRRGTDASYTQRADRERPVESANATGGFHLDVRRRAATHQTQIFVCGAGSAVAGRGLDEIGADVAGNAAEALLVLVL